MPKSSFLKWTYSRSGIDYRVALLFTRLHLTAIGIIPESLNSICQFYHAEINEKDITVSYGRTDPECRKTSFLKNTTYGLK